LFTEDIGEDEGNGSGGGVTLPPAGSHQ
jgi:hypothetical protein